MRSLPVVLSLAALIVACTKSEGTDPNASPSASSVPPMAASAPGASAPASASASAAVATAAPTGTGTTTNATDSGASGAVPGGATDAGKTAAAGGDAGGSAAGGNATGAGECGTKPLPDCPLQAWMKANMNPPSLAGDTAALATALEKAASFAPAGYTNWASICKDGAKAAKGGDLAAAKASCRSCHDQYKKKYQAEMRTRKI